jgi:hypothetical protein
MAKDWDVVQNQHNNDLEKKATSFEKMEEEYPNFFLFSNTHLTSFTILQLL